MVLIWSWISLSMSWKHWHIWHCSCYHCVKPVSVSRFQWECMMNNNGGMHCSTVDALISWFQAESKSWRSWPKLSVVCSRAMNQTCVALNASYSAMTSYRYCESKETLSTGVALLTSFQKHLNTANRASLTDTQVGSDVPELPATKDHACHVRLGQGQHRAEIK